MNKVIYQPNGKAREYSPWACNLYNGCTNLCNYCYNRHGVAAAVLGADQVSLKRQLGTPEKAIELFHKELAYHRDAIMRDGGRLFFSFVSDPCLPETRRLTFDCIDICCSWGITAVILTKCADLFLDDDFSYEYSILEEHINRIQIGFTLTGHDEMEPGASPTEQRIEAIRKLFFAGFHVWVSAEPIIDIKSTEDIFIQTIGFVNHYAFGLRSVGSHIAPPSIAAHSHCLASPQDVKSFMDNVNNTVKIYPNPPFVLWKESILSFIGNEQQ